MNDPRETAAFLLDLSARIPRSEAGVLFRALRERACGLAVPPAAETAEALSIGELCRVLPRRISGGAPGEATLRRLSELCAAPAPEEAAALEADAACLLSLAQEGRLPFSPEEARRAMDAWRKSGYSFAPGPSDPVPAYYVIRREHAKLLRPLARLDHLLSAQDRVIAALDGGSASGKTSAAALLQTLYGASVFHMDDFFLRPEQRTAARLAQPGGNVDYERFSQEVLAPLTRGEPVCFRRYDCRTQTLEPPRRVVPGALTVVEGAYSMRPELAPVYDLSVFFSITPAEQHRRIRLRNPPAMQAMFCSLWIPLENFYFQAMDVPSRCDLVVNADDTPPVLP